MIPVRKAVWFWNIFHSNIFNSYILVLHLNDLCYYIALCFLIKQMHTIRLRSFSAFAIENSKFIVNLFQIGGDSIANEVEAEFVARLAKFVQVGSMASFNIILVTLR